MAILNKEDTQSAIWKKIAAHVETRLSFFRRKNDNMKDEVETAKLRGKIAECKYILSLPDIKVEETTNE